MRDLKEHDPCEDPCCSCCIRFREAWTTGSIYRPGDAVPYNGSSYVAIHWNQNDPPPSANWATIASKGDTGSAGPAGAQGPAGPQGPPGRDASSDGATLALFGTEIVQFGTDGSVFARLAIPTGKYVIWATVPIFNRDGDGQDWTIQLRCDAAEAHIQGGASGRLPGLGSDGSGQTVPVLATVYTNTDATLEFWGYGFNIEALTCSIVAIPWRFA